MMVTAAQKIIKKTQITHARNFLLIKLVKFQSIWKSGSGSDRICHSKSGKIRLRPDWKKINPVQL